MSILDHPVISERYFFPRREAFDDPFVVKPALGLELACFRRISDPAAMTLLHFHGNGEVVADYLPELDEAVAAMGFNLVLAEYRGYGMSTGHPSMAAMLDDGVVVLQALELPPERVVAFGRSVGSIYAIHLAARVPQLAGLILESGIADPLTRVLMRAHPDELGVSEEQLRAEAGRLLDHQAKLAAFQGATLVMHTRHDGLIDVAHGLQLHAWAPEPKQLKIFDIGDHNSILAWNWQEYMQLVREFVADLG